MKKIAVSLIALALGLAFVPASPASEKPVKMQDLPAPVRQTVMLQSKGATVRGLAKEVEKGQTRYEAELTVNGMHKDILMDPSGKIVEVEQQVTLASLPAAVKASLDKHAAAGKILSVEAVSEAGAISAYEAVIQQGAHKREVRVSPAGHTLPND